MKHLLKGAIVTVAVLIASMAIHVFCEMKGIQLDPVVTGPVSAVCAMFFYQGLIRNEKDKES